MHSGSARQLAKQSTNCHLRAHPIPIHSVLPSILQVFRVFMSLSATLLRQKANLETVPAVPYARFTQIELRRRADPSHDETRQPFCSSRLPKLNAQISRLNTVFKASSSLTPSRSDCRLKRYPTSRSFSNESDSLSHLEVLRATFPHPR